MGKILLLLYILALAGILPGLSFAASSPSMSRLSWAAADSGSHPSMASAAPWADGSGAQSKPVKADFSSFMGDDTDEMFRQLKITPKEALLAVGMAVLFAGMCTVWPPLLIAGGVIILAGFLAPLFS